MANDVDIHLGRRLRRRRRLLGLTQETLANAIGVRFQQIQKYECAANKISAAQLWRLAGALDVPVGYFYDGMGAEASGGALPSKDTLALVRVYDELGDRPRRQLLDLARSLRAGTAA